MYIIEDNKGGITIIVNYGKHQRRSSKMCNEGPALLSNSKFWTFQKLEMNITMQFFLDETYRECYRLFHG